jgi:hypothetical protein
MFRIIVVILVYIPSSQTYRVQKFSMLYNVQTCFGTHSRVKRSKREVNRLPPSNAEVKIGGALRPLLHMLSSLSA